MAIEVETKDCTALSDSELEEMADIAIGGPAGYDIGVVSKAKDAWVLISQARENGKLLGYSFCTLERIGGTPAVLWGLAHIKRTAKRETVLKAILNDQFHRALLAFPDEDVLVGSRIIDPAGYVAFAGLSDIVPRPDYKATGEERAWCRRLAKRFGVEGKEDDRTFVVSGDGSPQGILDHEALKPEKLDPANEQFFKSLKKKSNDQLIIFGWAMAEDLLSKYGPA